MTVKAEQATIHRLHQVVKLTDKIVVEPVERGPCEHTVSAHSVFFKQLDDTIPNPGHAFQALALCKRQV